MVERDIVRRGVRDVRVLDAMRKVPRERFLPFERAHLAYTDAPVTIAEGQTMSQPYVVAWMAEAAGIAPGAQVLEVGTGSGYAAAVLAELAGRVYTVERHDALCAGARGRLSDLGYHNVTVRLGDGSLGWPEHAPFDAIVVAAGGPAAPRALLEQLAIGGRLVMPIGDLAAQQLVRIERAEIDRYIEERLGSVTFVPLVGTQGWPE